MNTHRIMVGVKGAGDTHPAIDWALSYAHSVQAQVELVHVVDMSWRSKPAPFAEATLLAAEQELRDLAAHHSSNTGEQPRSTVLIGHPTRLLAEHAANSDMVVLGASRVDRPGIVARDTLAARVAGRVAVSTVVVPRVEAVGHGIVVGVDGSELSVAPLAFAAREADRLGEPLVVIHSWFAPRPWTDKDISGWPAEPEDEERRVLAEAVAGIAEEYPDLHVNQSVVFARATDALYEAAEGARMLVVGSHGRQGLEKAWLGSTSEELILALPTAVAVIR